MGRHPKETPPGTPAPVVVEGGKAPEPGTTTKEELERLRLENRDAKAGDKKPRKPRTPKVDPPDEAKRAELAETAETFAGIVGKGANAVATKILRQDALVDEETTMLVAATKAYIRQSAEEDIAKLPGWALLATLGLIFVPRGLAAYDQYRKSKLPAAPLKADETA